MKMVIAVVLAVASGIPLWILVTRADKRRREVEALGMQREKSLISQEEFESKRRDILNRPYWSS